MAQIPPVVVDEGDLDEKVSDLELNEKEPMASDPVDGGDPLTEKSEQAAPSDSASKELPLPPLPDTPNEATT